MSLLGLLAFLNTIRKKIDNYHYQYHFVIFACFLRLTISIYLIYRYYVHGVTCEATLNRIKTEIQTVQKPPKNLND